MRTLRSSSVAVVPLIMGLFLSLPPGTRAEGLKYGWKTGDTYTYSVRIEAQERSYTDALQGNVICTIQAPDAPPLCIGTLEPEQVGKDGLAPARPQPSRLQHLSFGRAGVSKAITTTTAASGAKPLAMTQSFLLGDMGRVIADPLPADGKSTWIMENDCVIVVQPMPGAVTAAAPSFMTAHEKTIYTLGPQKEDSITFTREYDLKTKELVRGMPRVQITGQGQTTFDTRAGLPRSSTFTGFLINPAGAAAERIPLVVTTRLVENGVTPTAAPPVEARCLGTPKPEAGILTDDVKDLLLVELKLPQKRSEAARQLQSLAPGPDGHCTEIAQALVNALDDHDLFVRWGVVDALKFWGTTDSIIPLTKMLDDPEHAVRWATLEALGALKDPRAAVAMARRLPTGDGGFVVPAIIKLGPPAENAVLYYLKGYDWTTRMNACKILQQIGSKTAIPYLRAAAAEQGLVGTAASDAIIAITQRR